jgi:glutathione peroxidase-family protein
MATLLSRWHKELGPKGLVVISIDDGTSPSYDALKKKAQSNKWLYSILRDSTGDNVRNYGIKFGTASYLINTKGKVIWEGLPVKRAGELEEAIKDEVKNIDEIDLENWKKELDKK